MKSLVKVEKKATINFLLVLLFSMLSFFMPLHSYAKVSEIANDKDILSLQKSGKAFAGIAKKISPAVVNIYVEQIVGNRVLLESPFNFDKKEGVPPGFEDLFRYFFDAPSSGQKQLVVGQGSGFIISPDGYIVTNNHVIQKSSKIMVKLQNSKEYKAKIIGTDPRSDIAIIKIDAKNLPTLQFGDSDELEVGEWVVAVGNPFGLSHSLSAGIVSAKGRSYMGITDFEYFIQTDAAINPGNSGGPLVNLDGQVVGINTAIASRTGGYMGIGFAIPANMAKGIIDQLMQKGMVTRGYLGVRIQPLTTDLAKSFNVAEGISGILIAQVEDNSPAKQAGLKQGDIIIELDGEKVIGVSEFRNKIAINQPDTKHKVKILRNGNEKIVQVKIGHLPNSSSEEELSNSLNNENMSKLGINIQNLTEDIAKQLGIPETKGIVITSVESGSLADIVGLQRGYVILELNRQPIANVNQFKDALNKAQKNQSILLLVQSKLGYQYIVINLD